MKKLLLLLLLCNFENRVFAQKRLITHEDLIKIKTVRNPQLSPDGKNVLYELVESQYNEKENVTDLWIVPTDGSQVARRFTAQKSAESSASWSPNGTQILFTAKRETDEAAQIYLLDYKNGGEAQRLTNVASGVKSPKWSPNGKQILFYTNGFAGCYADSCFKKQNEAKKNAKSKVRIYESFPIQNFDEWLDEKQNQLLICDLNGKVENVTPTLNQFNHKYFKLNSATWLNNNEIAYDISLDSNTTLGYGINNHNVLELPSKTTRALNFGINDSYIASLQISDDGKILYFLKTIKNKEYYQIDKLWAVEYPSMKNAMEIIPNLDRPINEFQIISNNKVLASVEEEGNDKLMLFENSKKQMFIPANEDSYRAMQQKNGVTVALYSNGNTPTELVSIINSKTLKLTNHNEVLLAKLEIPKPETYFFTNAKGQKIRYLLYKPAKFDANKKYPLVHMMHGGPSASFKYSFATRWNAQFLAADKYVFLLTDYRGSTGYGEAFGNSIKLDAFRGPAEDILLAGKDAIAKNKFIDANRQAAGGASYGGHLANWMLGNAPQFKCLFNHAGLMNATTQWGVSDGVYSREIMNGGMYWVNDKLWQDQNPINYAKNFKTPMLISVGELDFRVPMNHSIETYHILKRKEIPAKLMVFPDENHWILKPENHKIFMAEVKDWLAKYLD